MLPLAQLNRKDGGLVNPFLTPGERVLEQLYHQLLLVYRLELQGQK